MMIMMIMIMMMMMMKMRAGYSKITITVMRSLMATLKAITDGDNYSHNHGWQLLLSNTDCNRPAANFMKIQAVEEGGGNNASSKI